MAIITIKNIVNKFKEVYDKDPRLNSFIFGQLSETRQDLDYPYMNIDIEDSTHYLIQGDNNRFAGLEYQFKIRICDMVNNSENKSTIQGEAENNGLDVISNTFVILIDFLMAINHDTNNIFKDLNMTDDIAITNVFHDDGADVNGVEATITLRTYVDKPCLSVITDIK